MFLERIPRELQSAWDRNAVQRERAGFATTNLLICILVPAWSLLDFYFERGLALRFAALRAADVLLTLGLARIIARSTDLRRSRTAMVASIGAVGVAIIAMLAQLGPAHYALYAFGFSLVFWGAGLLLAWPLYYCATTFAGLLVAHGLAWAVTRSVPVAEFVGSLFYLGSAAIISFAQSVLKLRLERSAFVASACLESRHAELASNVAALGEMQARLVASSTALAESLDLVATAERVVGIAVPSFATWATLTVAGPDGTVVCAADHVDPTTRANLRAALAQHAEVAVDGARGVTCIADATRDDVARATSPGASEIVQAGSLLAAPLVARGRRIGTLVLGRTARSYDASDKAFAEEIAHRSSLALDNARLYAMEQSARDLADAASRSKDEFLALVSHELRTPLSAILGWASMLSLPGLEDKKRKRAIDTIERNAVAMTQLIEDLLDVSRIVTGKLRLEMSEVEPAAVVAAAVESLRPAAEAKSIRIVQQLEAEAGLIKGDAARLQQVVWNLVSNAVKFTPAGGIVRVDLRRHDGHAEVVVGDTGKGIDPRFLPHVFEPFRQAEGSVSRPTAGLGLGLAIAKHIVELHGGAAEAFSEGAGRGAIFTVRLPLLAYTTRTVAPLAHRRLESPPQLDGLRVLVVEDEADMLQLIHDVLTACGSRVSTASSVAEAMDQFEHGQIPDVLVSDLGMEGESGYDLIRRVRQRPVNEGGRVPAAALTAYTRAEDRRKVLKAGFELHVPKPVEPAELVSVVATLAKFAEGSR